MNLKACTFERLAFISLGVGRGAQIGKTSLLEVEFIYGASVDVGRIHFYLVRFRPCDAAQTLDPPRQRSSVASQQHLRPRRFDSTVKRVPKLRFEPVSYLFLVCLSKAHCSDA